MINRPKHTTPIVRPRLIVLFGHVRRKLEPSASDAFLRASGLAYKPLIKRNLAAFGVDVPQALLKSFAWFHGNIPLTDELPKLLAAGFRRFLPGDDESVEERVFIAFFWLKGFERLFRLLLR
jgi:hypothetical protein